MAAEPMRFAPVAEPVSGPYPIRPRQRTAGAIVPGRRAVDHEDARQFRGAPPELNCITGALVSFRAAAAETGQTGRLLVRERDDN